MSYTNADLVRSHLTVPADSAERSLTQPFSLTGTDYQAIFGGAIIEGSLQVRSIQQRDLSSAAFAISSTPQSLSANGVRPGSVILASDSSLGTIYTENVDYAVDWESGSVDVKSGGSLSTGQNVVAWFYPFTLYTEDIDYRVDHSSGKIARVSSGNIADGETVWLRFEPESSAFADELIEAGVRDANGLIEAEIDPDQEFGANPVLVSAATYRALEIVCRAAAARELASRKGLHQTANGWITLSETYHSLAERWLRSFRPPASSPASPTIS